MNDNYIEDLTPEELSEVLVGKVVTGISENTMTLDNGQILHFEDTEGCCSWFNAKLTAGELTENAVTSVKRIETDEEDILFSVHILAVDAKIADLSVTGDEGTGWYCHSIDLRITTKES